MLTVAVQQGINGIVVGSLYVLVALGLTLIYGVLVQINFAHADIVTLGAFAAYFFTHGLGGGYVPSIAPPMPASAEAITKVSMISRFGSMPIRPAVSRSCATARNALPRYVSFMKA